MAERGRVMHVDGHVEHINVRREEMSVIEFDAWKKRRADENHTILCINPKCIGRLYFQRRHETQLLAHFPGEAGGSPDCPYRRGESPIHLEVKDLLRSSLEDIGLRVDTETRLAGRIPDTQAFRPDKPTSYGPVWAGEAQCAGLDLPTFDARDRDLNEALNAYREEYGGRRAVPWFFTFTPSFAATRAVLQVEKDDPTQVVSGIYRLNDVDGDPLEAHAKAVVAGIVEGSLMRVEISRGQEQWIAQPRFKATPGKRRSPRTGKTSSGQTQPCARGGGLPEFMRCSWCATYELVYQDIDGERLCMRCMAERPMPYTQGVLPLAAPQPLVRSDGRKFSSWLTSLAEQERKPN